MKKLNRYIYPTVAVLLVGLLSYFIYLNTRYIPVLYQTYSEGVEITDFPYRFEFNEEMVYTDEPGFELYDPYDYPNGLGWLIHQVDDGSYGEEIRTYRSTINDEGVTLSKTYVPDSLVVKEATPIRHEYGAPVEEGAYFYSKWTTAYGVNCDGCYVDENNIGGTASGIKLGLNSVRQSDGTWREGITYDGYYVVAADKNLPFCTVLEISNHGFSGQGLEPGVPFKAVVLDRGGAITGSDIDLFTGDERNSGVYNGKRKGMKVEIVDFGRWTRNSLGQRACSLG